MAKKDKVIDLKSRVEKISEGQLKQLQSIVSTSNKLQFDIGNIEAKKHNLLHALFQANDNIRELQNGFKEKYGTVDINIQDGTINYEDEQTDKKD